MRKLSEKISIEPSKMPRRLVALDEKCVKVSDLEYWVYATIDVDRDEVLPMRAIPSRNVLATKLFIEDVLKYCDGRPIFVVDSASWLRSVLKELRLRYSVESFRL
jgi:putative transposase